MSSASSRQQLVISSSSSSRSFTFRLGLDIPRDSRQFISAELAASSHGEIGNGPDTILILNSFEGKEFKEACQKYDVIVGVPFIKQFFRDPSVLQRLSPLKHPLFHFLIDPTRTICFADGTPEAVKQVLSKYARWMGSSVTLDLQANTYVIAEKASLNPESIYQKAILARADISSPQWLFDMWSTGLAQAHQKLRPLEGLKVCGDITHEKLKNTGAQISTLEYADLAIATSSSSHIVSRANALFLPIVHITWIEESIKAKVALPPTDFPLPEELGFAVSSSSFFESFIIDVSLLPEDLLDQARVDINNGGGMWSMDGNAHEACCHLTTVLIPAQDTAETFIVPPKHGTWLKKSIARGVPVLKSGWLNACVAAKKLLPWREYKANINFATSEGQRFLVSQKSEVSIAESLDFPPTALSDNEKIFSHQVLAFCGAHLADEVAQFYKTKVEEFGGKFIYGDVVPLAREIQFYVVADGMTPSRCKELENRQKRFYKKNVVSIHWLNLCCSTKVILQVPHPYLPMLQPSVVPKSEAEGIMKGYRFHFAHIWEKKYDHNLKCFFPEQIHVNQLAVASGARACKHGKWDKVTHYIVLNVDDRARLQDKLEEAEKRNIPIVRYQWLVDSYKKGVQQDVNKYLVTATAMPKPSLDFYRNENAQSEAEATQKKVFRNHIFRFSPKSLLEMKCEIVTAVQDDGGEVDLYHKVNVCPNGKILVHLACDGEYIKCDPDYKGVVINVKWLTESIKQRRLLPMSFFLQKEPSSGALANSNDVRRSNLSVQWSSRKPPNLALCDREEQAVDEKAKLEHAFQKAAEQLKKIDYAAYEKSTAAAAPAVNPSLKKEDSTATLALNTAKPHTSLRRMDSSSDVLLSASMRNLKREPTSSAAALPQNKGKQLRRMDSSAASGRL